MKVQEDAQGLVERVRARERTVRKRTWLLTGVPVVLAVLLLSLTGYRLQEGISDLASVNSQLDQSELELSEVHASLEMSEATLAGARQDLEATRQEAARLATDLAEARITLQELTVNLEQATDWQQFVYRGNIFLLLKSLGGMQGNVLTDILSLQEADIPFSLGGLSLEEGFDSPSFAAHILHRYELLPGTIRELRYSIRDVFETTRRPKSGDLALYEFGYTMFYFSGAREDAFVIGMTPLGILALRPDFAPLVGYRSIPYPY